jgi:hypothetical protein
LYIVVLTILITIVVAAIAIAIIFIVFAATAMPAGFASAFIQPSRNKGY